MRKIDLSGEIFGRLTVISQAQSSGKKTRWLCMCLCGSEAIVNSGNLRSGHTQSCGCFANEVKVVSNTIHGESKSTEYKSYAMAKNRCLNSSSEDFKDYGARGIKFNFESFEQFLSVLGKKPRGKSLGRIKNDGNYEPGNVRWETPTEQSNNRRSNHKIEAFGKNLTISEWSQETGVSQSAISWRVNRNWSGEKAVSNTKKEKNK